VTFCEGADAADVAALADGAAADVDGATELDGAGGAAELGVWVGVYAGEVYVGALDVAGGLIGVAGAGGAGLSVGALDGAEGTGGGGVAVCEAGG
jgi:hypothetical protein